MERTQRHSFDLTFEIATLIESAPSPIVSPPQPAESERKQEGGGDVAEENEEEVDEEILDDDDWKTVDLKLKIQSLKEEVFFLVCQTFHIFYLSFVRLQLADLHGYKTVVEKKLFDLNSSVKTLTKALEEVFELCLSIKYPFFICCSFLGEGDKR